MKRSHLLLAAGIGVGALGLATPALAQKVSALETSFQALLDSAVEAGSTPGMMMRVDAPSLGLSWSGVSGVADMETGTPLTPANPVRIVNRRRIITGEIGCYDDALLKSQAARLG